MYDRFTDSAKRAIIDAQEHARTATVAVLIIWLRSWRWPDSGW